MFNNHYDCECGTSWNDTSEGTQDDQCPNCGTSCSPTETTDAPLRTYDVTIACNVCAYASEQIEAYSDDDAKKKARALFADDAQVSYDTDWSTAQSDRIVLLETGDVGKARTIEEDVYIDNAGARKVFHGVFDHRHGTDLLFSFSEVGFYADLAERIKHEIGDEVPEGLEGEAVLDWWGEQETDYSGIFTFQWSWEFI